MNRSNTTRSSLFLLELMIAILFFSLGSAVCVQVFVKAHTLNESARDLNFASTQVSSAASVIKYADGTLSSLQKYYPHMQETPEGFTIFYDREHQECDEEDRAFYRLSITLEEQESMKIAHLQMKKQKDNSLLYELKLHYPDAARKTT